MKQRQLLCTFSNSTCYKNDIRKMADLYPRMFIKFFVFQNQKSSKDVYITYNVDTSNGFAKFPTTISIHRKKETNSLYTLNAMNRIIEDENGGVFDPTFNVNWELYKNCLILTGDISVRIIDIKLIDVI